MPADLTPETLRTWQRDPLAFAAALTIRRPDGTMGPPQFSARQASWLRALAAREGGRPRYKTVAVVAPKHIRHHRLTLRPIRPLTIEEANQRDWAEIENLEKGGPIAIADFYVDNSGSRDTLHTALDDVLKHIDF